MLDVPIYSFHRVLMEGITDLVFVIRAEEENFFVYDFMNQKAMEKTGLSERDIGKSFSDVYSKEPAEVLNAHYQKALSTKQSIVYEDAYLSVSGEIRYSKTTLTPLFDLQENKPPQIVAVVKDITKEKNTEKEVLKVWNRVNESKKRFQSLFDYHPDAIFSIDPDGLITNGNGAVETLTGYVPSELVASSFELRVHEKYREIYQQLFTDAVKGTTVDSHIAIRHRIGKRMDVSIRMIPLIIDQEVVGIYGILRDETEKLKVEEKLKESEERYRIITENAHDLVTLINEKGKIIYVSPSYKTILGYEKKEYIGKPYTHNLDIADYEEFQQAITQSIKNREPFTIQFKQYNHQQQPIWCEAHGTPVFDQENNFKHVVVLTRDIHLQKQYETELQFFALHDSLTGLPNRRHFNQKLKDILEQPKNQKSKLAVMMIDIDNFKGINDQMGHDVGDAVIEELGRRLSRTMCADGLAARLGGDEFSVLLPDIGSSSTALSVAESIQNAIKEPWNIHGGPLQVTISIGIAIASTKEAEDSSMLKKADMALYQAKEAGKNTFSLWEEEGLQEKQVHSETI